MSHSTKILNEKNFFFSFKKLPHYLTFNTRNAEHLVLMMGNVGEKVGAYLSIQNIILTWGKKKPQNLFENCTKLG